MSESIIDYDISALSFQLQKKYIQNHTAEFREIMQFSSGRKTIDEISKKVECLEDRVKTFEHENSIEWTTISIVANKKGLTSDAIRKRLQNGDFEEGVDFKFDGNKIVVHQGAIGRLQRKRRSSNG